MARGIKCNSCGCAESEVVDSRGSESSVYRRRMCLSCGGRFTTIELLVKKRTGRPIGSVNSGPRVKNEVSEPEDVGSRYSCDDCEWIFYVEGLHDEMICPNCASQNVWLSSRKYKVKKVRSLSSIPREDKSGES